MPVVKYEPRNLDPKDYALISDWQKAERELESASYEAAQVMRKAGLTKVEIIPDDVRLVAGPLREEEPEKEAES